MFRHILVPVDCTEDARRLAQQIAPLAAQLVPCRFTLAAAVTPTEDETLMEKRRQHAGQALRNLHSLLQGYGVWTRLRVVEGKDHAAAYATETLRSAELYDGVVMGTYQTRLEDLEAPCRGSLADQICQRVRVPVVVLPASAG